MGIIKNTNLTGIKDISFSKAKSNGQIKEETESSIFLEVKMNKSSLKEKVENHKSTLSTEDINKIQKNISDFSEAGVLTHGKRTFFITAGKKEGDKYKDYVFDYSKFEEYYKNAHPGKELPSNYTLKDLKSDLGIPSGIIREANDLDGIPGNLDLYKVKEFEYIEVPAEVIQAYCPDAK